MADVISSTANPLVKRVRALADRKHRRREGAFVVQGIQPVWQAVEARADIEVLLVAPDLLSHRGALDMVDAQAAAGVPVARLTGQLFGRISDRDGPAGLAAIVRAELTTVGALAVPGDGVFVALHAVGNPGNVGTIIRTASAAGAAGVILVGPSADPHDPAAVKSSMGALFTVPVATALSPREFLAWAVERSVCVAATSARASVSCWDAAWRLPLVLLLGSEGSGLPDDLLAAADLRVAIPMTGTAESLNLAVAAGVLLYEARRRTWSDAPPSLSP
ncbi:MAG: TrmH family RNA methyltransferase [Streptosporangiaceae bacterium]